MSGLVREIARASFRLSTLLSLTLLAFVWLGTAAYLRLDYDKTQQSAVQDNNNTARFFEEHVERSIKEIDKLLIYVGNEYLKDPKAFDLPGWASNSYFLQDLTVQLSLIGPDGMMLMTNVNRNPPPTDLSDREHFRVHLDNKSTGLFISKPILGRVTGKWTVQLTRRLTRADGSFAGVSVASLDPYHLSKLFEQVDLGRGGAITLIGTDGIIRARGGLQPEMLGKSIADTPLFNQMISSTNGLFRGATPSSPGDRLVSFRRMKSFPLIVSAARSMEDVLQDYAATERVFLRTATGLTVLILMVLGIGVAHEIRLSRAKARQQESDRQVGRAYVKMTAILENMSQGILMLDQDRNLRILNRRAVELVNKPEQLKIGEPLQADVMQVLQQTGDADCWEAALANGTELEIHRTLMPEGRLLYTLTDITSRKRNEAILAEARDRAEAGVRARTSFLATMSHEIRTPLNGVVGLAQLLVDSADQDERALYAETMQDSAAHLLQIVDDVLDLSRLDADRMLFESVPIEIAEVVRGSLRMLGAKAQEKKLTLSCEVEDGVPSHVIGDPRRLRQILLNLIGNAVKFTDWGSVKVKLKVLPGLQGFDQRIAIDITDTGIGISPENIQHLFQDFAQIDGSITRKYGGTGLGLAISRKLIEKMGGDITVESKLGEGSTFRIILPVLAVASGRKTVVDASRGSTPGAGSGLAILLVEDNPTNTMVARKLLEKMGHRVGTAADGVEALAALKRDRFDLLLTDVMMPQMDGLTLTQTVRRSGEGYADMPIIALTAATQSEDQERAFAAGVDGFVTKPVSYDRLKSAIVAALDGDRPHRAVA